MTNVKEMDREQKMFFTYQISRQEPERCRSLSPLSLDSELNKHFGEPNATPTKEWKQRAEPNKKRRKMWKNSSNSFAF